MSPSSSPSHSHSHSRSQSPTAVDCQWPEINSDYEFSEERVTLGADDDGDVLDELEDTSNYPKLPKPSSVVRESIGMKPGRTGVKGVLRDRNELNALEEMRRRAKIREMNERMERMDLGGMTYLEEKAFDEEAERQHELDAENDWEERRRTRMEFRTGRFGHLREIGVSNFVGTIENEAPNVWVVVHVYDQVRPFIRYSLFSHKNLTIIVL